MYCAVTALFNTVSVPSVIVTESLVQVTVVAGPPVEIQVRVFIESIIPPGMMIFPNIIPTHAVIIYVTLSIYNILYTGIS